MDILRELLEMKSKLYKYKKLPNLGPVVKQKAAEVAREAENPKSRWEELLEKYRRENGNKLVP